MSALLITYDLNKDSPSDKWGIVRDAITRAFPTHWCKLTTTWVVETPHSPEQVRDWLAAYLDDNDELLVVDISDRRLAWLGLEQVDADWLRAVLGP